MCPTTKESRELHLRSLKEPRGGKMSREVFEILFFLFDIYTFFPQDGPSTSYSSSCILVWYLTVDKRFLLYSDEEWDVRRKLNAQREVFYKRVYERVYK